MKKLAVITASAIFSMGTVQVASAANTINADGFKVNSAVSPNANSVPKAHTKPAVIPTAPKGGNAFGHTAKDSGNRGLGTPAPAGNALGFAAK